MANQGAHDGSMIDAMPTIIDVARVAGVSVSTVSRVLNGRSDVSEATRRSVQEAIDRLSFAPRATARRLVSRQSRALSLLFPATYASLSSFDLDFVLGAATATSERDYFFNMVTDALTDTHLLHMYRSGLVDGVILMQILLDDWRVQLLNEQRLPFVAIGRPADTNGLNYIDLDFEGGVTAMVDFLVSLGHRQIAAIGRPHAQVASGLGAAVRAQESFFQAAVRHGIAPIAIATDLNAAAMAQATYHLIDTHPELTAIVTTNGPATVGVLQALRERGRAVPGDISVIAISTDRVAELLTPALTNVRFPSADIGHQAASMLIRRLDERQTGLAARVEQILISPSITMRDTTAPPRAGR